MRDTIKDEYSPHTGEHRYETMSRYSPRLRPGEKKIQPVAPGLFVKKSFKNKFLRKIHRLIRADLSFCLVKFSFIVLSTLVLFSTNGKVEAVPVFETDIDYSWSSINNLVAGRSSSEDDSLFLHYPWWAHSDLKKVVNVERIPALDSRYYFLENMLYRFIGGSYEPGSIGHPWLPNFKYYPTVTIKYITGREYVDFWGQFAFFNEPANHGDILSTYIGDYNTGQYIVTEPGWYVIRIYRDDPSTPYKDGAIPGDHITFETIKYNTEEAYPVETSQNLPVWTNHKDRIRVDINAVPEPSTLVLFGITALGFFRMSKYRNV